MAEGALDPYVFLTWTSTFLHHTSSSPGPRLPSYHTSFLPGPRLPSYHTSSSPGPRLSFIIRLLLLDLDFPPTIRLSYLDLDFPPTIRLLLLDLDFPPTIRLLLLDLDFPPTIRLSYLDLDFPPTIRLLLLDLDFPSTTPTMVFPATTTFELLVHITWGCLCASLWKQSLFAQILSSQSVLLEICSAANLVFCPGLFNVIQNAYAPAVNFFESLPSDTARRWGVYVLVFQKPNAIPLIYIGSGTNSRDGVSARLGEYDRPARGTIPQYVENALRENYKIVHKGLLVWAPIPPAADIPRFRLIFIIIEAVFSFLFWAIISKTKDYDIGICCL